MHNIFGKLKEKVNAKWQNGKNTIEKLKLDISNEEWTTAGIALLDKYENDWKEISENNEQNANCTDDIVKKIDKLGIRMQKQRVVMTTLNVWLSGLPKVSATLKASQQLLQQVQALTEIVEDKFKRLQDLCEECDLQETMLHMQCELSKYNEQKMAKLESFRRDVVLEHERNAQAHGEHLRKIQLERQEIFDTCFSDDLAEYQRHGCIKQRALTNALYKISLEDVNLEDMQPRDALEEFLNG